MNLFSLFATLTLDDSQYTKSVENIKKSASDMKYDIMEVAQTYKSESAVMSDVMEQAYEDINQSQQETTDTAKTESEKVKEYWTGTAFDISKGWDLLKTGFKTAVAGITAVTGALLAAEAATEEYRIAMGKLNTAYEAAGYSAETAYQAYSDFYAILGDTDTATEASQLLAKLAQSEEDVAKWTEIAAGVNGTFGDSLPIEGLIESANETAKVGQVTGVLADALNWAGISEDEFNTKLEAAGSEAERNKLIMDTLSATYDEAADAFYKNNEQIIKNRENQQKLTEVMADVGQAVSDVKNAFLDEFMPAITDAGEKVTDFLEQIDAEEIIATVIEKITEIKDLFIAWSPVIAGVTTAILTFRTAMTISALIDNATKAMTAFKTAQNAATVAQAALNYVMSINPFVLVATLIAGVTAALVTLWVTNEDFRNAIISVWETIQNVFINAWEIITELWGQAVAFFFGIAEGIYNTFSTVPEILYNIFSQAWAAVKSVFNDWASFFSGLLDKAINAFSSAYERFIEVGSNIVNGIKDGISAAWDGLVSWFNNLWDSLFDRSVDVDVDYGSSRSYDGSHRSGLNYVPFDGYVAQLHQGEMVLTKEQASNYRQGGVTVIQNIYSEAKTAADLMREARYEQERAVLMGV